MTILETERLLLRPLVAADAPQMTALAGDYDVAAGTLTLPHPYAQSDAEQFISRFQTASSADPDHVFALALRADDRLIGVIGLHEARSFLRAEMGYWLGKPYWNQGYASEAARRLVRYGFETLNLNRIHAACFFGECDTSRFDCAKTRPDSDGRPAATETTADACQSQWGTFGLTTAQEETQWG